MYLLIHNVKHLPWRVGIYRGCLCTYKCSNLFLKARKLVYCMHVCTCCYRPSNNTPRHWATICIYYRISMKLLAKRSIIIKLFKNRCVIIMIHQSAYKIYRICKKMAIHMCAGLLFSIF